tara:strand:+ start:40 stop:231 length:192 start_codon:yes stop_codon:yes gene_type:complete
MNIRGRVNVRGTKNQRPKIFTLDLIEAKKIMAKIAMLKFEVFLYARRNKERDAKTAQIGARYL